MDITVTGTRNIFFSIIIPSYNRASFVIKAIDSFLNQTYPHFELIVIDDGSTDNTRDVVAAIKDDRVKYYWKENAERGAARNYGATLVTGDYINYFDSDDLAYHNHLQEAFNAIQKLNAPPVFYLGYEMKDEHGKLIFRKKPEKGNGNRKMLKVNYVNPNPVFVRKDTLKEVTYQCDRNLSATEDWLYHLQLAARYSLIAYDQVITSCMIQHDSRSMNEYSGDRVLKRNELLLHYLRADDCFMARYGKQLHTIEAEMKGLAALHFVLEKKKMKAIQQLFISLKFSPILVFKRRTLAIIKYILF